uniref:RNA-directed DNA polymerase, eukaryota n=1 Tax=Tanacetum cinerariifolium TaxID=118510 RepID=A0A6L2NI26_TANCI|nr:RNA-directed DNA polymerase, eukaryota [Tanacetum cinerariifolium]
MPEFNIKSEDDTSSNEESEQNNENDLGSDNEHVSETSFVQENDVEFQKNPNPSGKTVISEDPFGIYKILKRNKDTSGTDADTPQNPSGFTLVVEENVVGNNPRNTSQPNPTTSGNIEKAPSDNGKCNHGTWIPSSTKLLIISVYAPQDLIERRMLWDFIRYLIDYWDGECVLLGDFNEV